MSSNEYLSKSCLISVHTSYPLHSDYPRLSAATTHCIYCYSPTLSSNYGVLSYSMLTTNFFISDRQLTSSDGRLSTHYRWLSRCIVSNDFGVSVILLDLTGGVSFTGYSMMKKA
jgi:hypothetical protein